RHRFIFGRMVDAVSMVLNSLEGNWRQFGGRISCRPDEHSRVDKRSARQIGWKRVWASAQRMARPPRVLATRLGGRRTDDATPFELYRVGPGRTEPRHGPAARYNDECAVAAAKCESAGRRLEPRLATTRT